MASEPAHTPLRDLRVIDFSSEIAGPYCTRLLADAGADVIKVEEGDGDPTRRWSATGADLGGGDGALFCFLNASKRSITGRPGDPAVRELIESADLVVESFDPVRADVLVHSELSASGKRMLTLHKQSASAKTTHERTALARQIEATDGEIDRLVYELYGLSDEEIRIVEEATAR